MQPTHYTAVEGGDWEMWPKGVWLFQDFLDRRAKRQPAAITYLIAKPAIKIHSLKFDKPAVRWDCINGWTGRIRG